MEVHRKFVSEVSFMISKFDGSLETLKKDKLSFKQHWILLFSGKNNE
jgi:hypothetical protein